MQTHKMCNAAWALTSGMVIAVASASAAPASAPPIAADDMPMAD